MKTLAILATLALASCAEIGSLTIDTPWVSGSKDAMGNVTITPKVSAIVIPTK